MLLQFHLQSWYTFYRHTKTPMASSLRSSELLPVYLQNPLHHIVVPCSKFQMDPYHFLRE